MSYFFDTYKDARPGDFIVRKYSRREEFDRGADFEAWVLQGVDQATRVWVQAKRMFPGGTFKYLDRLKQIEDLIEMANRHRAIPQIALYCYEAPKPKTYCCRRRQPQHYGCTIVRAEFVLNELRYGKGPGKITLTDLARESQPWRCLACSRFLRVLRGNDSRGAWSVDNMPRYARELLERNPQPEDDADLADSVARQVRPDWVATLRAPAN